MATLSNLDWNSVCEAIASVYGTDAQTVATTLTDNGVALGDVESAFKMLKGTTYEVWYNADGTVRSYNYVGMPETYLTKSASAGVSQTINSNTQVATKTAVKIPLNTTASLTEPTKTSWKAGLAQTGNFVFKEILPAVAAANVGITLGKAIDSTLYNANPDYWDSIGWSSLNPDTWASITQNDDSGLATAFNFIYKIDPNTNKSQAYMDEMAFAYLTGILHNNGFFATGEIVYPPTPTIGDIVTVNSFVSLNTLINECIPNPIVASAMYEACIQHGWPEFGAYKMNFRSPTASAAFQQDLALYPNISTGSTFTYNEDASDTCECLYYDFNMASSDPDTAVTIRGFTTNAEYLKDFIGLTGSGGSGPDGATTMGTINGTEESATEGISDQPDATVFDNSGIADASDISAILALLMSQYPDLFNNAVTQDVVQPDGSIKEYTYIPVGQVQPNPNPTDGYDPDVQPISAASTQVNPEVDPETAPETQLEYIISLLTDIANPNLEDTGTGTTPIVIAPTGSSQALYRVWNPTETQLNDFGGWLWSSNFVDQLLKVFNDPMQAIIGLHKVFATPSVGGTANIKVGYLDSGVSSNYIDEQYVTVDCGTVSLIEQYQNVFDYAPFTDVSLYLPFIGFVRLDVSDVMRGTINVKYHVDVLTGACLAEVSVTRDMYGGVLYTYSGNCSVTYPLSSGSYMGIVGTIASIAGGIAGTLATGGAAAPMMLGAAAGALNAHTNVERSGSLSGNSGAMGIKKPYLVISRPQTNLANNFETFLGKPANFTTTLSSASGFVSCTDVHLINCNATDSEIAEIESLLRSGIII